MGSLVRVRGSQSSPVACCFFLYSVLCSRLMLMFMLVSVFWMLLLLCHLDFNDSALVLFGRSLHTSEWFRR